MKREIYEVDARIVDANGTFNHLTGYPKTFDSKSYGNDTNKTMQRAYGEMYDALAAMAKIDTRQEQLATILRMSDGVQIESKRFGELADLPDPEPEGGEE